MENLKPPTILVIDDDDDVVELLQRALKTDSSIHILYAGTGAEAMTLMNNNTINAVVLDVKLPDITGITLGLKIREVLPDIPIAVFTSYEGDEIKKRVERLNAFYWFKSEILTAPEKVIFCLHNLLLGKSCTNDSAEFKIPKYLTGIQHVH